MEHRSKENLVSKTILVIAAHADDEALGCGGTIARHVAEGDIVHLVLMADGVTSRSHARNIDLEQRDAAAKKAHEILGIKSVHRLGYADNSMDSVPLLKIIQDLEGIAEFISPSVIYTHHDGDLNIDHRITNQAVLTAFRPTPSSSVREIYTFEVMSSTEWSTPTRSPFLPNYFVDISDFLELKIESLRAYECEMRKEPHSRSFSHIAHLARHRGHTVGFWAAEAFMTVRCLR